MTERRTSSNDLDKFYREELKKQGRQEVEELVKRKRSTEKDQRLQKSIFLCHSHLDKTIVEKITLLFNKLDINIYVDWMDKTLPRVTNYNTAKLIKEKILHCNRFIYLATYHGLRSKWCDWELGIAYSLKRIEELALLPIESKSGKWEGSEYLGLYPIMILGDTLDQLKINEVSIKRYTDNSEIPLQQWLTQ